MLIIDVMNQKEKTFQGPLWLIFCSGQGMSQIKKTWAKWELSGPNEVNGVFQDTNTVTYYTYIKHEKDNWKHSMTFNFAQDFSAIFTVYMGTPSDDTF